MHALAKATYSSLLLLAGVAGPAMAGDPVNTGVFGGVAVKGYDVVAYFTDGHAMKGSNRFAYGWLGTPWYFASEKHRSMFQSSPAKFAPQFGGYCTLGIAIDGHAAENIDPVNAWRIIDGKLYFVYSAAYAGELDGPASKEWVKKAEANWPQVKAQVEKELGN